MSNAKVSDIDWRLEQAIIAAHAACHGRAAVDHTGCTLEPCHTLVDLLDEIRDTIAHG